MGESCRDRGTFRLADGGIAMRKLRSWFLRLWGISQGARDDEQFSEEIASHLEMHIADNIRAGMTPEEARRAALVKLGGDEPTRSASCYQAAFTFINSLIQDNRHWVR